MTTLPRKSVVALGVVSSIVVGTLFAVAAPSLADASTSSDVSAIVAKLNAVRTHHTALAALGRNAFVDRDAEEYAKQYASDPSGDLDSFTPATPLPEDTLGNQPDSTGVFTASISGTSVTTLASALVAADGGELTGAYNYIGVGYATEGSHAYGYVVLLHYANPPLKRITPGTATIPTTARIGTDISVKVRGFSPSGLTYSYAWYSGGSLFDSSLPEASLQTGNFAKDVDVVVTAHRAGYADTSVTSNSTKPLEPGIPFAPKTLTITGKRNVGQTLFAPGENTDGWGPYFVNTYSYQWLRNGVAIGGATSDSYVLQPGDYGKRVDLRMSLTGSDYLVSTRQTHTHSLVGHQFLYVLASPLISGGDETWGTSRTPEYNIFIEGVHYGLKWLLDGHVVGTGFTYTPSASAGGKHLSVEVTGTLSGFAPTTVTSAAVSVLDKTFTDSPDASISGGTGPGGSAEIGDKLVATVTEPSAPAATSDTYQWYLDDVAVKGATHTTYTFKPTSAILSISFTVTAHRSGYTPSAFTTSIPYN